jgi:KDO2-lipid IV(A) lauroyltransferase
VNKKEKRGLFKGFLDVLTLVLLYIIYTITRVIPMCVMSFVFGVLALLICPFIRETYLANRNLREAYPKKNLLDRIKIICGMWFNLGMFAGEYCYATSLSMENLEKIVNFVGNREEFLTDVLNNCKNKKGTLFISGHFSNWEICLNYIILILKVKVNLVYRQSNNTLLEKNLVQKLKKNINVNLIAKQDNAGIKIFRALKNGEVVILMIDQVDKRNGILSNFFGRKVYTNTATFSLYKKLDIDLYYFYFLRQKNFFKIDLFHEKLIFDRDRITEGTFTDALNKKLEDSIRRKPSQWFWVHDRWWVRDEAEQILLKK